MCDNVDGPRRQYAEWDKPDWERKVPHDFTYMYNLKTNKQPNKRTHPIIWTEKLIAWLPPGVAENLRWSSLTPTAYEPQGQGGARKKSAVSPQPPTLREIQEETGPVSPGRLRQLPLLARPGTEPVGQAEVRSAVGGRDRELGTQRQSVHNWHRGVSLCIDLENFFIYSGNTWYTGYLCCKHFLPLCDVSFSLSMVSFKKQKLFILMQFNLSIFFMVLLLVSCVWSLFYPKAVRIFSNVFLRSFTVFFSHLDLQSAWSWVLWMAGVR